MNKNKFFILNKFYYPHKGGVETTVEEHATWLAKNNINETKVLVSNEKPFQLTQFKKVKNNLTIIKGSFFDNRISVRVKPLSNDIKAMREVYLDVDVANSSFTAYKE